MFRQARLLILARRWLSRSTRTSARMCPNTKGRFFWYVRSIRSIYIYTLHNTCFVWRLPLCLPEVYAKEYVSPRVSDGASKKARTPPAKRSDHKPARVAMESWSFRRGLSQLTATGAPVISPRDCIRMRVDSSYACAWVTLVAVYRYVDARKITRVGKYLPLPPLRSLSLFL